MKQNMSLLTSMHPQMYTVHIRSAKTQRKGVKKATTYTGRMDAYKMESRWRKVRTNKERKREKDWDTGRGGESLGAGTLKQNLFLARVPWV
jgi:hypothetical protein